MKQPIRLYVAGLELTLACPCRCETCGSDAGKKRKDELSFDEWKPVLKTLAALGCTRAGLLGGEPLLYEGWQEVARAARAEKIAVEMITSGIGIDAAVAGEIENIGFASVTVSIDGTQAVHDDQRRIQDAYSQAMDAVRYLRGAGVKVGVNTQINSKSLKTLEALAPKLEEAGVLGWQLQVTMPRGRAAGCADVAVLPEQMPEVYEVVRALTRRRGLRPYISDNLGYMTKDDPRLRTPPGVFSRCWLGCFAGIRAVGIMSNGDVKGCLALPDELIEGNLRDTPLGEIWEDPDRFSYNRSFDEASLEGACKDCTFGKVCRGGCTAFAMAVHGKPNISTHCFRLWQNQGES